MWSHGRATVRRKGPWEHQTPSVVNNKRKGLTAGRRNSLAAHGLALLFVFGLSFCSERQYPKASGNDCRVACKILGLSDSFSLWTLSIHNLSLFSNEIISNCPLLCCEVTWL
jgi:hypothetical protein